MDENDRNDEVYIEDAAEANISRGLDALLITNPGSDEYKKINDAICKLYELRIKYTQTEMEYEDHEAQRKHEAKMKQLDREIKLLEIEAEKIKNQSQIDAQKKANKWNLITNILSGVVNVGLPVGINAILLLLVIKGEYVDDKYFGSTAFKNLSPSLTRLIRSGKF